MVKTTLWKPLENVQLRLTCSKFTNKNTRTTREICSNSAIKTPECHWTYFTPFSNVSIGDFGQVNVSWVMTFYKFIGILL